MVARFLDDHFPLASDSHADVSSYAVDGDGLAATVKDDVVRLADPAQLVGYHGSQDSPEAVLLVHHGLHVEIQIDPDDSIGATDAAGVKDLLVESAVSTIMDLEDSVAAVDADDKVLGYRNWLRLMDGSLAEEVTKGGKTFTRAMNPDRTYTGPDGDEVTLRGRSLLFIRQVGHLMTSNAVLDDGDEVPEGHPRRGDDGARQPRRPPGPHRARPTLGPGPSMWSGRGTGPDEAAYLALDAVLARVSRGNPGRPDRDGEGRRDGRRAANDAEPQGVHSGGRAPVSPSSTPASSTEPATRSTRRWRPAPSCAKPR